MLIEAVHDPDRLQHTEPPKVSSETPSLFFLRQSAST